MMNEIPAKDLSGNNLTSLPRQSTFPGHAGQKPGGGAEAPTLRRCREESGNVIS
jgi:hypothetical protein